jgi:hypothetical protein
LRTEAKLSACSISEKWRFHLFQAHSKVLLLLLQRQQCKFEFLRVVLFREKEEFLSLLRRAEERPQPKRKLKLVDLWAEKSMQQKRLNWGTVVIDCPIPQTLFPTIIS